MLQLLAGDLVQLPRIPPTLHLPTSYGQCLCHQQANINLVEDQRPWCHVVAHAVWAVKAWSAHARCELSTCMVTSGRSRRYCSAALYHTAGAVYSTVSGETAAEVDAAEELFSRHAEKPLHGS